MDVSHTARKLHVHILPYMVAVLPYILARASERTWLRPLYRSYPGATRGDGGGAAHGGGSHGAASGAAVVTSRAACTAGKPLQPAAAAAGPVVLVPAASPSAAAAPAAATPPCTPSLPSAPGAPLVFGITRLLRSGASRSGAIPQTRHFNRHRTPSSLCISGLIGSSSARGGPRLISVNAPMSLACAASGDGGSTASDAVCDLLAEAAIAAALNGSSTAAGGGGGLRPLAGNPVASPAAFAWPPALAPERTAVNTWPSGCPCRQLRCTPLELLVRHRLPPSKPGRPHQQGSQLQPPEASKAPAAAAATTSSGPLATVPLLVLPAEAAAEVVRLYGEALGRTTQVNVQFLLRGMTGMTEAEVRQAQPQLQVSSPPAGKAKTLEANSPTGGQPGEPGPAKFGRFVDHQARPRPRFTSTATAAGGHSGPATHASPSSAMQQHTWAVPSMPSAGHHTVRPMGYARELNSQGFSPGASISGLRSPDAFKEAA
ncbi:hypothetical protein TSOC_004163 [Tetrabaena socialis]|uniref:Uncharacterized protein n=1 Tax=Tetrabaena socialis TaxID=47790 RepID=A0A2J8A9P6_9CHLO|nr:hypothetical protein TSOC_004163 [Tetrabaena socialis]|eukprot:PNH09231.1 hypothetical protein TSOC_004163 [Tetrabaena socialis]